MVLERHGEERFGKGISLDYAKVNEFAKELVEEFDIGRQVVLITLQEVFPEAISRKLLLRVRCPVNLMCSLPFNQHEALTWAPSSLFTRRLFASVTAVQHILLISLELDEVMDVSDRIAVIYAGQIVGEFEQGAITESRQASSWRRWCRVTTLTKIMRKPITSAIVAILFGFFVATIVLASAGYDPIEAFGALIDGMIGKPKYIANVIIKATPLLFTGVAVAFAFRVGLFNIGAEGQYVFGTVLPQS